MSSGSAGDSAVKLAALTEAGLSEAEAKTLLDAVGGSVEAAMEAYLGSEEEKGSEERMMIPPPPPPQNFADSIVSRAEQGSKAEKQEDSVKKQSDLWKSLSGGARLGTGAAQEEEEKEPVVEMMDTTTAAAETTPTAAAAAKAVTEIRVEVIFFADGFTVEEEAEEKRLEKEKPVVAAVKKTGIATLRDHASSSGRRPASTGRRRPPPALRAFDEPTNEAFLSHLNRNEVPPEFRRLDDNGRPVRVRFGVADARPARCPWAGGDKNEDSDDDDEDDDEDMMTRRKSKNTPPPSSFTGEGHSLRGDSTASVPTESEAAETPVVDEAKPKTTIQIRLSDNRRLRCVLNTDHTVAHVHALIRDAGADEKPYQLLAGFPPVVLQDAAKTIAEMKLAGAAIQQKTI